MLFLLLTGALSPSLRHTPPPPLLLSQVYVASIGGDSITRRMRLAQMLWAADIPTEFSHKDNPKLKTQLDEVLERGIPFMVVFGSDEAARAVVKVKNVLTHTEIEVSESDMVARLIQEGCQPVVSAERGFLDALAKASTK